MISSSNNFLLSPQQQLANNEHVLDFGVVSFFFIINICQKCLELIAFIIYNNFIETK